MRRFSFFLRSNVKRLIFSLRLWIDRRIGPLQSVAEQRHAVHYLGLACSPCMFVHDNKVLSCWFSQARCMAGIAPSEVLASVDALLAGEQQAAGRRLRVVDS